MDAMATVNPTAAVLLGLLELGPAPSTEGYGEDAGMTGWQLHETVNASVGGFWNITRSQIYLELSRLADVGLAAESGSPGTRGQQAYRITAAGREAFADWIAALAREAPRADQLRSPLTLLVFFGEMVPPELLRRSLQEHRALRERRRERLEAVASAVQRDDARRLPAAVLRRGIAIAELHVRWIDEVLELLGDG
jgi:DNA-binding PadR family transcriptional regulator